MVSIALLALAAILWIATAGSEGEFLHAYSFTRFLLNVLATYAAIMGAYVLARRTERRIRQIQVALLTILLAIGFFLLELPAILLRHNYEVTFSTATDATALQVSESVNRRDPELIHIHWPNSSYKGEVVGNLVHLGIPDPPRYLVDVRYDENGFRNDGGRNHFDVVAIGDSFVEADLIPLEKTVVRTLERETGLSVGNFGQAAYGLRQELAVLRRFALSRRPQLVIWFFFAGNDLRDVEYYEELVKNYDHLDDPPPLKHRLFIRNALRAQARALERLRTEPTAYARARSARYLRADGVEETVYFGQSNGAWTDHQWEVLTGTLLEAKELSTKAGARFMVVFIDRKFRIYRPHLREPIGEELRSWAVNDLPDAMRRWCEAQGIELVDTIPALAEEVARGRPVYFPDDVHWNERGHEIAAKTIAEKLRSLGWIQ